ncbi:hypothetical protein [Melittangium boletus]|uniref:hypothetical protein n=1 Tax=Melittangium boletus TaxID=83453 RepID=UPI003DA29FE8
MNFGKCVVGLVCCVGLMGACGPAMEGEALEDTGEETSLTPANKKPRSTEADPTADLEPGRVYQQTLVGDLGGVVASPAATYPTTCSASNQWRTTCGSGSSRDISYVWKVPETGSYTFSTSGSAFDTVMEIRNYKATSEVMGCNDDVGSSLQSRINLSGLVKGVTLLITIEGYEGECGAARLNITKR